jgi:DNA-binding MurR/RpiR family transcriptional regulator
MAKTIRRGGQWLMRHDRELIALSKTHTLEAIADQLQRPPATILRAAKRLGLSIKRGAKRK